MTSRQIIWIRCNLCTVKIRTGNEKFLVRIFKFSEQDIMDNKEDTNAARVTGGLAKVNVNLKFTQLPNTSNQF